MATKKTAGKAAAPQQGILFSNTDDPGVHQHEKILAHKHDLMKLASERVAAVISTNKEKTVKKKPAVKKAIKPKLIKPAKKTMKPVKKAVAKKASKTAKPSAASKKKRNKYL